LRFGKVMGTDFCTLGGRDRCLESIGREKNSLRPLAQFVIAAGALTATVLPLRAAEQITLRNGFEITCNHHGTANRRVRLYMEKGNESYIEVAPGDIASVEHIPDPPPPPSPDPSPAPAPVSDLRSDVKLSPADLNEMLAKAGHEHNVDMDLLASVVKAESGGNARAVSRAGAQGLMQLMPATAADLGVSDSFKPEQNVRGGSTYLDELLTRYHDNLALALAAYNAGPAAVDKYNGIPPYRETKLYVARVIHEFNRRVKAREAQTRRDAENRRVVAMSAPQGN
jgi:Transglycosylase SLT domain